MWQLQRSLIGNRGWLFSYFCRQNLINRRKLCWFKKNIFYQVMIFIPLTVCFCDGNLLFIYYSYTVPWIQTNSLQNWNEEKNVKYWEDLNMYPFHLHSMLLPLSYICISVCAIWCDFSCIPSPETTLVKFVIWFYFFFMSLF